MLEGDVAPARKQLRRSAGGVRRAHLCRGDGVGRGAMGGTVGTLRVPGNASAPAASLLLAPSWLFAHFPYGDFFSQYSVIAAVIADYYVMEPLIAM